MLEAAAEDPWEEPAQEPLIEEGSPTEELLPEEAVVAEEPSPDLPAEDESGVYDEAQQEPGPGTKHQLAERTKGLLEYLKDLLEVLPSDMRGEFEISGVKERLDHLIDQLEKAREGIPVEDRHEGLMARAEELRLHPRAPSSPQPLRPLDPRRSQVGRRKESDRRTIQERRHEDKDRSDVQQRRLESDRRLPTDRRSPPPAIEFPAHLPKDAAFLRLDDKGNPVEIAGIKVSAKLARLIEILRKERGRGNR